MTKHRPKTAREIIAANIEAAWRILKAASDIEVLTPGTLTGPEEMKLGEALTAVERAAVR